MQICASEGAAVSSCPFSCIDGFRGTEIEGQLRNDLPTKTEVRAATETIDGRDGKSIKYIVLVDVDAIGPVLSIKELKPQSDAQRCRV